jgi:Uma2 family endonuclease
MVGLSMAFEPGIIITGPEPAEIALIAEVKISSRSIDDSERQLKKYMAAVSSPVGLLGTPEHLRIFRDQYLPSEDSVIRVGEFSVKEVFQFAKSGNAAADAFGFERQVQSWLETLSSESGLEQLTPELRRAAQMYIVPALTQGSIRSGHPRLPATA